MIQLSLTGDKYVNETLNVCMTTYKDQSGEILFVGKEVTSGLGYVNATHAIARHVDEEDMYRLVNVKGVSESDTPSNSQPHKLLINESGLYSLILRSNMPKAKDFKRWVTKEVLPSIRKSGFYALPEVLIAIKGVELDDVRELDGERRKEFRKESKIRSDLAKDPDKVLLGKIGGKATQDRVREQRDENQRLREENSELQKENKHLTISNKELKSDVRDIIEWVRDLHEGEKLTRV